MVKCIDGRFSYLRKVMGIFFVFLTAIELYGWTIYGWFHGINLHICSSLLPFSFFFSFGLFYPFFCLPILLSSLLSPLTCLTNWHCLWACLTSPSCFFVLLPSKQNAVILVLPNFLLLDSMTIMELEWGILSQASDKKKRLNCLLRILIDQW